MNRTLVSLLLLLGACDQASKDTGAGKAEGEILPGSASDAMLPLDTVRSQAPLAPRVEASGKQRGGEPSDVASDAAPEDAAAGPAEAEAGTPPVEAP